MLTPYVRVIVAAALVALAAPQPAIAESPQEPQSVLDWVLTALSERAGGVLPTEVTVESAEGPLRVPLAEALALVPDAPITSMGGPAGEDVGFGVRVGPYPCYVAAVVTSFAFTGGPALEVEETVVAPEPVVPCGLGLRSWMGEAKATVPDYAYPAACVAYEGALGMWANSPYQCHVEDFREVTITGRVGRFDFAECAPTFCFTVQQVFGGTVNAPGRLDSVPIVLK